MGSFSYICQGCGTSIRNGFKGIENFDTYKGGEKCILIHIREGVELGRVEGRYDGYGSVVGENLLTGFRNDDPTDINSCDEIHKSSYYYGSSSNSGIAAWHSVCYHRSKDHEWDYMYPSDNDPEQGCGHIRKKFI